ncbi:MAG TPA: FixH family protein [Allosphingosinicella sp.]
MSGPFTGRHMAAIMLGFFAVVASVNALMATLASRTFGGTVVDNSYVAGQRFNGWLAEARAQKALGWTVAIARTREGRLEANLAAPAGPVAGAAVTATAHHPLGRAPEMRLAFSPSGGGTYLSSAPLPDGRWIVRLSASKDGSEARFVRDLGR